MEKEAHRHLSEEQYLHVASLLLQLAYEPNPRIPRGGAFDVRPYQDVFELRCKGGELGKINVRVYFDVDDGLRILGFLVFDKKEQEGKPSRRVARLVDRRRRYWKEQMKGRE